MQRACSKRRCIFLPLPASLRQRTCTGRRSAHPRAAQRRHAWRPDHRGIDRRRPSVSRFVLDNSVTMAWCFTEEATELTEALLSRLSNLTDTALVPALWLYEVVNVTELAARKGRINAQKARAFLESLADLPIEIENPTLQHMFVSVPVLVGQYRSEEHASERQSPCN